jgi:hypothetical protein
MGFSIHVTEGHIKELPLIVHIYFYNLSSVVLKFVFLPLKVHVLLAVFCISLPFLQLEFISLKLHVSLGLIVIYPSLLLECISSKLPVLFRFMI